MNIVKMISTQRRKDAKRLKQKRFNMFAVMSEMFFRVSASLCSNIRE